MACLYGRAAAARHRRPPRCFWRRRRRHVVRQVPRRGFRCPLTALHAEGRLRDGPLGCSALRVPGERVEGSFVRERWRPGGGALTRGRSAPRRGAQVRPLAPPRRPPLQGASPGRQPAPAGIPAPSAWPRPLPPAPHSAPRRKPQTPTRRRARRPTASGAGSSSSSGPPAKYASASTRLRAAIMWTWSRVRPMSHSWAACQSKALKSARTADTAQRRPCHGPRHGEAGGSSGLWPENFERSPARYARTALSTRAQTSSSEVMGEKRRRKTVRVQHGPQRSCSTSA